MRKNYFCCCYVKGSEFKSKKREENKIPLQLDKKISSKNLYTGCKSLKNSKSSENKNHFLVYETTLR